MSIIENFLLGGTIVSLISYLATHINPIYAAIIWSFPISLLPALYTMKSDGKTNKEISLFAFQSSYTIILLFIATFSISFFTKRGNSITLSIIYASLIWMLCSIIYYLIMSK
jgi:uncharacterized membrane protein (GlpM family)